MKGLEKKKNPAKQAILTRSQAIQTRSITLGLFH